MRSSKNWIQLLKEADLFIYGHSHGTILLTPRSEKIWSLIKAKINAQFVALGIENVLFPALIPLAELEKEKSNFQGFSPELFLIQQIGTKKLDQKNWLALRPTSEVVFCHYFQQKTKSYRDLPILLNQWTNVWRAEKNTYPFLRTTEFFWQEGHGIFADRKQMTIFLGKVNDAYQTVLEKNLLIFPFFGKKSICERFAGAKETWTFETILPDGQFLQLATAHDLGQNFSQIYEIEFLNKENLKVCAEQASWGLSTRILAAIFLTHADEQGLILPPQIADQQIWILVLPTIKESNCHQKYSENIGKKLTNYGYRLKIIEMKNKSLGNWIHKWEKQGIPIRIEIGEEEVKKNELTIVSRTELKRKKIAIKDSPTRIEWMLQEMEKKMSKQNKAKQQNLIQEVDDFQEFCAIKSSSKAYLVEFCGEAECEKKIQHKTTMNSRATQSELNKKYKCFHCQKSPACKTIFGRAY